MKHLLNGVAIAAVLAIAAPGLAQAGATKSPAMSGASAAPKKAASATSATPPKHHKATHHARARHHRMSRHAQDTMANQLNRQELQRIESHAPPPKHQKPEKPRGG